jgi:hypothetical protein
MPLRLVEGKERFLIRKATDYLNQTNPEDSAARFFGRSTLEAEGFSRA